MTDNIELGKVSSRCWILTIPADSCSDGERTWLDAVEAHDGWGCVGQKEKGEETGYEHYQVYVRTPKIRGTAVKKVFPSTTHIEPCRVPEASEQYCQKVDSRIDGPWSTKDFELSLGQGKRTDLEARDEAGERVLTEGACPDDLIFENPRLATYAGYLRTLQSARLRQVGKGLRTVDVSYVYGSTGVGKSLWAYLYGRRHGTSTYRVTDYEHPWDSYNGEDVVVFEEFTGKVRVGQLLEWLDRYPVLLPARYANKNACFTKVVFTSNKPLLSWYPSISQEHAEALRRRIGADLHLVNENGLARFCEANGGLTLRRGFVAESLSDMVREANGDD